MERSRSKSKSKGMEKAEDEDKKKIRSSSETMIMKSDIPGERVNDRVKTTHSAFLSVPLEYRMKWKWRKQQQKRKGISTSGLVKPKRWTKNKVRMTKKKGQGQPLGDKEKSQHGKERLKQTQKLVKKNSKLESKNHQRTRAKTSTSTQGKDDGNGKTKTPKIKNCKNVLAKNIKTCKSTPVIKDEPNVDLGKLEENRQTKRKKLKQQHFGEEGSCPTCGKYFTCSDSLFQHYTIEHINEAGYPNKARIMELEQEHQKKNKTSGNESRSVVCDQCGKEFYDANTAARHRRDMHEEGPGTNSEQFLQCPHCGKTYKSKDALGAHIRQMHEGQDFRCEVCNKKCQTSAKLWRHKRDDHNMRDLPLPPNLELLICSYCGLEIFRGLEAHVRKMHPDNLDEFKAQQKLKAKAKAKAMKRNPAAYDKTKNKQKLRKREIRRKIKELGAEEVRRQGMIIPDYIFKKECRFCRRTILQRDFTNHLKNVHGIVEEGEDKDSLSLSLSLNQVIENRKLIKVWNRVPNVFNKFSEFICALCPQIRSRRVNLVKMHLLKEHMDALTSDDLELTPTQATLKSHPRPPLPQSDTTPSATTNCPHCTETFSTEVELLTHAKANHPRQCLNCPECSKLLISPEVVTIHFLTGHSNTDNNEDVSMTETETETLTTEEKSSQSEESENVTFFKVSFLTMAHPMQSKYPCKRCEISCTTKPKLLQHVQEYHPGNFFLCPAENCGLVKFTLQGLYRHLVILHPKNKNASVDSYSAFTLNSFVPYKNLVVACPIVGCKSVNKQQITLAKFEQHLKTSHHINEDPEELNEMLKCKICSEKYQTRLKFLVHLEEDHGHVVQMKDVIKRLTSRVIGGQGSRTKVTKFNGRKRKASRTKAHAYDVDRESESDMDLEVEEEPSKKSLRRSTRVSAKKNARDREDRASAVKVKNSNEEINFNGIKTKSCFVRIERLSQSEIEQYMNRNREYASNWIKKENCDLVDFEEEFYN